MKFPFDAFILDTAFRVKPVKLVGQHGADAFQTAEGTVVQSYEVSLSKDAAEQRAKLGKENIQELVFERRSRGG